MFVFLDDGEALTIGSEEAGSSITVMGTVSGSIENSLAGVIGGIFRTVSRAVAAQKSGSILWGNGGVLRFDACTLQDIVRVLTCSWVNRHPSIQKRSAFTHLITGKTSE